MPFNLGIDRGLSKVNRHFRITSIVCKEKNGLDGVDMISNPKIIKPRINISLATVDIEHLYIFLSKHFLNRGGKSTAPFACASSNEEKEAISSVNLRLCLSAVDFPKGFNGILVTDQFEIKQSILCPSPAVCI